MERKVKKKNFLACQISASTFVSICLGRHAGAEVESLSEGLPGTPALIAS
jgi:hypothetical protein